MASDQVDTSDDVDFSVFGVELPRLNPYVQDVYGCLLNNRMYVFQPNCKMDLELPRLHLVATIKLFVRFTFKALRWLMWLSALARNSPVQAFDSISTLEFTEQPFLRILCLTVMWFSVP